MQRPALHALLQLLVAAGVVPPTPDLQQHCRKDKLERQKRQHWRVRRVGQPDLMVPRPRAILLAEVVLPRVRHVPVGRVFPSLEVAALRNVVEEVLRSVPLPHGSVGVELHVPLPAEVWQHPMRIVVVSNEFDFVCAVLPTKSEVAPYTTRPRVARDTPNSDPPISEKLWRAGSRRYRPRGLQVNAHFSAL